MGTVCALVPLSVVVVEDAGTVPRIYLRGREVPIVAFGKGLGNCPVMALVAGMDVGFVDSSRDYPGVFLEGVCPSSGLVGCYFVGFCQIREGRGLARECYL